MNNLIKRVWNRRGMTHIEDLQGFAFSNESGGHTFQISGVEDGTMVVLSGTVAASFLRPDQATVAITGSISGGVVSVTLPANCYDIPGRFGLVIFLTSDSQTTAIYSCVGNVARSSTSQVAPGTTADVVDLIDQIQAAVATIPQSWPGLMADIAPTYSASAVYPVGAYVYYNGDLYRCTTAITTAESWTAGHWTAAVLGNDLHDLKSAKVSKEPVNLVDTSTSVSGYINYDNSIISSSSYKTTDYIFVKKGVTYTFTPAARFALFFYTDKQVVGNSYMSTLTQNYTFTPEADRYVRISYATSQESNVALKSSLASTGEKIEEGIELSNLQKSQIPAVVENAGFVKPSGVDSQIDAKIVSEHLASTDYVDAKIGDIVAVGSNLYNNKQDLTTGFIKEDGTLNTGGAWDGYRTSDYIKLPAGTYTIVRYPVVATRIAVLIFDSTKAIKSYDYSGQADTYNTFTLTENGFIRFSSSNKAMLDDAMLLAGEYSAPTAYIPYTMELNEDIIVPYSGNILFGKKWWACGDSFTEWTTEQFDASKYPNITVVDDRFHYATYPFWIGTRNNMTVHNFAVSGQTMAYPTVKYDGTPSTFQNAFSNGKYQTIPEDVDYITLWFGINDSHHRPGSQGGDGESNEGIIELGTIDSTATNTFYGAWNTVLEYLITNHPWAKIGIIITNGAETTDYANAEIALAKKWGIPYLDLNGDYKLPLMLRVDGKPDVCAEAVAIRKSQQWANVAQGNGHPNVNAHKFESTFIENWLRSI